MESVLSRFKLLRESTKVLPNLEDVSCPVCLDIFASPTTISCGHTFCESCLAHCEGAEPSCPMCRAMFDPTKKVAAQDIEKTVSSHKGTCVGCNKRMALSKLRAHHATCTKLGNPSEGGACAMPEGQKLDVCEPNRYTFTCPYCGLRNLDIRSLRDHCNAKHAKSMTRVVCPICAAMPWGSSKQTSSNFLGHLNLRHSFEYDTFVDYKLSDDEAMKKALEASLYEK